MEERQALVNKLVTLLKSRADLKNALEASLQKAGRPGLATLENFYLYL